MLLNCISRLPLAVKLAVVCGTSVMTVGATSPVAAQSSRTVTKYFDDDPAAGVKEQYTVVNNQISGSYTAYYRNGVVKERATMRAGKPEGKTTKYNSDGDVTSVCMYTAGRLNGLSTYYERNRDDCSKNGKLFERRLLYKQGNAVSETVYVEGVKVGAIQNGTYQNVKDGTYWWRSGDKMDYTLSGAVQGESITGSIGVSLQADRNGARLYCPLTNVNGLTMLLGDETLAALGKIVERYQAKYPSKSTPDHAVLHIQGSTIVNPGRNSYAYLTPAQIDFVELWYRGEFLIKVPYKSLQ